MANVATKSVLLDESSLREECLEEKKEVVNLKEIVLTEAIFEFLSETFAHPVRELIGKGGYGKVFKYTIKEKLESKEDGCDERVYNLAIKILIPKRRWLYQDFCDNGSALLLGLIHPNISEVKHVIVYNLDLKSFFIRSNLSEFLNSDVILGNIQTFSPFGNLSELMKKRVKEDNYFTTDEMLIIIKQILDGIIFLNNNNLFHSDLKLRNILIANEEDLTVKLCDFNFLRKFEISSIFYKMCGSLNYMAPELFGSTGYGPKIDVFSFGAIVMEILTGKKIFRCLAKRREDFYETTKRIRTLFIEQFQENKLCFITDDKTKTQIEFFKHSLIRLKDKNLCENVYKITDIMEIIVRSLHPIPAKRACFKELLDLTNRALHFKLDTEAM